jgi:hypothetical protein
MKTQMRHNYRNKLKYNKKTKINIKKVKKTKRIKRCQRGSGQTAVNYKNNHLPDSQSDVPQIPKILSKSDVPSKENVEIIIKERIKKNIRGKRDGIVIESDFLCKNSEYFGNSLNMVKHITFYLDNCDNKNKLKDISEILSTNTTIRTIVFRNISSIEDIKNIANFLKKNTAITKLILKNNNLDEYINETKISNTSGTSLIFDALRENMKSKIEEIYIGGCKICSKCVDSIAIYLKNNPNLLSLSMSETDISNEGVQKIMKALEKNTKLKVLHLDKQDYITENCKKAIYRSPLKQSKQIYLEPPPTVSHTNTNIETIEKDCKIESENSKPKKRAPPPIPGSKKPSNTGVIYDLGSNGSNQHATYSMGSANSVTSNESHYAELINFNPDPTNNKNKSSSLHYSLGNAIGNNKTNYHVYDVGTANANANVNK